MTVSEGNLGAGEKGCGEDISYCFLYIFNSSFKIITMKHG